MQFIGFYRELESNGPAVYEHSLPPPGSGASAYPHAEITQYLLSGYPALDVMELTSDVTGDAFRVPGGPSVLTDGLFVWRLDLAHYVRHYSIELPQSFLDAARTHEYRVPVVAQDRHV